MTTERALQSVALPVATRPGARGIAQDVPRARPVVARHPASRSEPLLTTPARAGMLIGASAAVYAVTLAGVGGLQSQSDAELAARRQPWVEQIAEMRAANDALEATLVDAGTRTQALGDLYARTGDELVAFEARLDALAALVAEVQGTAAALPTRISLPKVTTRGAVTSRPPKTTSTSGASGG